MLQNVMIGAPSVTQFQPSVTTEKETDPRLLSALRFIHSNYSQPSLGLKHVSHAVGLSFWHFSRLFNAGMGMGFREYVKNVRLKHACTLLKSSSLSIKEIAAAVGYTHLSDFYHHFKNQYGISPLVFRRSAHSKSLIESLPETRNSTNRQYTSIFEACCT
jgi:transcriptional regulator GlxA family with amidase domain